MAYTKVHRQPASVRWSPLCVLISYIRVVAAQVTGGSKNELVLKLYTAVRSVVLRDAGQSMSEYAMAVALIAFGCVAGEGAVASSVNHTFIALATTITTGILH